MPESAQKLNTQTAKRHHPGRSSLRSWRSKVFRALWLWREKGLGYILSRMWQRLGRATQSYEDWIEKNDTLSPRDLAQIQQRIRQLPRRPLISLILSIDAANAVNYRATIDSIRSQIYDEWQLHIVVHGSHDDVRAALEEQARLDKRIAIMVAAASDQVGNVNAALGAAAGEFVGFPASNDQLASHALYLIAEEIVAFPGANMIYTDEDRIDDNGRRLSPQFKTDWNPDLFLSQNYFGQFTLYRRETVAPIGFRPGFNGCNGYDLALRTIERVAPDTIRHIPYILVHRGEGAGDADDGEALRVVLDHINRIGIHAATEKSGRHVRVRRMLPSAPPRVSIIIPTRDRADLLRGAVESILDKTEYPDFEIVVVDNQTAEPAALSYLASLASRPKVRVLQFDKAFSHSAINNFAVKQCGSPVLAFLNNDVIVIGGGWLAEMVSQAVRPEVGAVGAMLYYPDDIIQHSGVILGFGGVASNCYSGLHRGSSGYFSRAKLLQNYSAVTAACLVTRAAAFKEVGGFNETDLPVAFNDVDYCLRLREKGYLVAWTPYAELYHLESVSRGDDMSPSKIERFRRDQAYMTRRWGPTLMCDPYYNPNLSLDGASFALAAVPRLRRPWRTEGQESV